MEADYESPISPASEINLADNKKLQESIFEGNVNPIKTGSSTRISKNMKNDIFS